MFSKLAKPVVLAAVVGVASAFNYDRCDPLNGPANAWPLLGMCGGLEQSPINLCGAVPLPGAPNLLPGQLDAQMQNQNPLPGTNYSLIGNFYQNPTIVTLQNLGYTISMKLAPGQALLAGGQPFLQVPALHNLIGRAERDSNVTVDWVFDHLEVHFGRNDNSNEGSEHAMEGRRYPAEISLIHYNKWRGATLDAALATGKKDAALVVGVMLDIGIGELPIITTLAGAGPALLPPPLSTPMNSTLAVMLQDAFDPADAFYAYAGSLTTPGCNEQVTYMVMKTPRYITPQSLDLLKKTMETVTNPLSTTGNYRPIQPVGARQVYFSMNVSVPCQLNPVAEPCTICANGAVTFEAKTLDQPAEAASAGTPTYVWIAIGVAIPTVILAAAGVAMYYGSYRRSHPTEKVMMSFSPFNQEAVAVPNTDNL